MTTTASCDVCIVGAGLAGLNALFVAGRYLSRDQKVILIDRRERVGGMWVDTYPYVRLHQPHPMFTAGNIEWTLGQDRSYLATKGEGLDPLRTLRSPQWSGAVDSAALCHTAFEFIHSVFPYTPAVLGQDQRHSTI